ncbi:Adenylosuccinate synthetase [Metarhizium album ARSEF 1941]|uniref:Adenylosuccinate synthetase n=1 Tax=Metarhizium album (strain ARSEF 1941) TaxID=1081103 RepID=A0A0B2WLL8_METAS|nr:Adenylosuccinate synthetase [Metarhizium album ARSEF 1941]KHN94579.1 Adenylosuccinate synthetase [Metarhizium album ARSEF 1941]
MHHFADHCCHSANGVSYSFHLLPSGLINPKCTNFIGSDVSFHVPSFFSELKQLDEKGLSDVYSRIFVSDRAHINFDLHAAVDGLEEIELGAQDRHHWPRDYKSTLFMPLTTQANFTVNGPSYSTKAARSGIRLADVFDQELFEAKLRRLAYGYKARYGDLLKYDVDEEIKRFRGYRTELAKYAIDGLSFMHSAQTSDMNMIIEGANVRALISQEAVMLDISMGSYPYVTSSNTTISGIIAGLTLNPKNITETIGVVKAWSERSSRRLAANGEHPQAEDVAVADLVVVKHGHMINYYTSLNLTKLDVLDSFETIKVAIAYKDKSTGKELDCYPADHNTLDNAEVVYHEMPGWKKPTTSARTYYDLPKQARDYVEYIEKFVGVKIKWIGTGPDREDMITRG